MTDVTPGWELVYDGIEGPVAALGGVNIWESKWHDPQVSPIVVAHPTYPAQRHKMWVHEIALPTGRIRFAAGEFSNGIWGVYVPAKHTGGGIA